MISNAIQSYEKNSDKGIGDIGGIKGGKDIRDIKEIRSIRDIEISAVADDCNNVIFSVRDHGKGVADSVKDKIFKEMTTTKGREGTGIGLYLSYSKIKAMFNGDMWFDSEEGKGATFYIKVPVIKEQELNK